MAVVKGFDTSWSLGTADGDVFDYTLNSASGLGLDESLQILAVA